MVDLTREEEIARTRTIQACRERRIEFARDIARWLGPLGCGWDRLTRIAVFETAREFATRRLGEYREKCWKHWHPKCDGSDNCICQLTPDPQEARLLRPVQFFGGAISSERLDAAYADEAKVKRVDFNDHVHPAGSYWQRLKARKFESVAYRCENCGEKCHWAALECHHHRGFDCLGFEEVADVQALCMRCYRGRRMIPVRVS